jgi:hypothetical protein
VSSSGGSVNGGGSGANASNNWLSDMSTGASPSNTAMMGQICLYNHLIPSSLTLLQT